MSKKNKKAKQEEVVLEPVTAPETVAAPVAAPVAPDYSILQAPPANMLSAYPRSSYDDIFAPTPKQKLKIEVGQSPIEDKIYVETAQTSVLSTRLYNDPQVEAIVADRISKLPKAKKKGNGCRNFFIILTVIFAVTTAIFALSYFKYHDATLDIVKKVVDLF